MNGYLKLWIEADRDGTGELFAQFDVNGFAGIGSAWFDLANLAEEAKLFAQYPLPQKQLVTLEGGYWSKDKHGALSQEHLHISLYPINARGGLALGIRVATHFEEGEPEHSRFSSSAQLKTNYEDIARFAKDLGLLARGEISEVRLEDNEV